MSKSLKYCHFIFGQNQKIILPFLLVFLIGKSQAQEAQHSKDTTVYWSSLNKYFNLSIDFETDYETFDLKGADFEYDIRPNFNYINLIGIDYPISCRQG